MVELVQPKSCRREKRLEMHPNISTVLASLTASVLNQCVILSYKNDLSFLNEQLESAYFRHQCDLQLKRKNMMKDYKYSAKTVPKIVIVKCGVLSMDRCKSWKTHAKLSHQVTSVK